MLSPLWARASGFPASSLRAASPSTRKAVKHHLQMWSFGSFWKSEWTSFCLSSRTTSVLFKFVNIRSTKSGWKSPHFLLRAEPECGCRTCLELWKGIRVVWAFWIIPSRRQVWSRSSTSSQRSRRKRLGLLLESFVKNEF